jgi:hypothetical protein
MPNDNNAIVHRFEQAFAANDIAGRGHRPWWEHGDRPDGGHARRSAPGVVRRAHPQRPQPPRPWILSSEGGLMASPSRRQGNRELAASRIAS